jgi:hypothetical protein
LRNLAKYVFFYRNYSKIEGGKMNMKATLKKGSVIAALSLSLSAFAAVPGNDVLAAGNNNPAAQKLVDSLKA